MLAAVRIRGIPDTPENVSATLEKLQLTQKNACVVLEDTESNRGMLNAVKDFVAYGEIDEGTVDALDADGEPVRLSPPSGGFRDPKRRYGQGGSVGERDDIDELLERML
ncbi:MAG: uL30 family ribosomal protein [Candidatus Nanohaloarchaea archaeon]|nr:uL30 family ribosomal protein [Candidatus Nanohaloarchaea archaeon]